LVSVVIPTFNRARFIQHAIDSVFSQTFRNFELIVVDDGSTDDTPIRIGSLFKSEKILKDRLHYISIAHSGVSRARNIGIDKAQGDWIAFLDSDDYWLSKKLEKQVAFLSENPEYKICHTDEVWIKDGKRINQGKKHIKYSGWFFIHSLNLCLISPSSVVIHRSIFDKIGKFDENFTFVEDYELWLRITSQYPVGFVNEKLVVKKGGHRDQLSQKINGIEGYRISALEKLITHTTLKKEFLKKALNVYKKKCSIYVNGCRKRGKLEEAEQVEFRLKNVLSGINTSLLEADNYQH
jgi:glycosyltransferase involved in cell wall biosynthesis